MTRSLHFDIPHCLEKRPGFPSKIYSTVCGYSGDRLVAWRSCDARLRAAKGRDEMDDAR